MSGPLSQRSKVVLTGGSSAVGLAMCQLLLAAGHEVVVLARGAANMASAQGLHLIPCDLSDPDAVRTCIATVAESHPDASVLINNAALQYDRSLTDPEFEPERMEDEVAINLLAPALLVHGLLPTLRSHDGAAIININSGLAIYPKQATALYCATKAGLHSFSQSLRYQLEHIAISVHEVFLPLVDTPMTLGRGSGKISAQYAADAILAGLARGNLNIWVGKARLIPVLNRLAPALGRKALRGPR